MSELSLEAVPAPEEAPAFPPVWNWKGGLLALGLFTIGFIIANIAQVVILVEANGGLEAFREAFAEGTIAIPFEAALATFLINGVGGIFSVWAGLRVIGKRLSDIGWSVNWRWIGIALLISIPLLAIRLGIGMGLLALMPELIEQAEVLSQMFGDASSPVTIILSLLAVSVLVPISEEMVFRGLIHRWARNHMSLWPAALLSALIFSIYHLNLLQGVSVFFLGLGCSWVYEKSRSLWPAIAIHMLGNFVGQGFLFIGMLFPELMGQ